MSLLASLVVAAALLFAVLGAAWLPAHPRRGRAASAFVPPGYGHGDASGSGWAGDGASASGEGGGGGCDGG